MNLTNNCNWNAFLCAFNSHPHTHKQSYRRIKLLKYKRQKLSFAWCIPSREVYETNRKSVTITGDLNHHLKYHHTLRHLSKKHWCSSLSQCITCEPKSNKKGFKYRIVSNTTLKTVTRHWEQQLDVHTSFSSFSPIFVSDWLYVLSWISVLRVKEIHSSLIWEMSKC